MADILLIEDDVAIRTALSRGLRDLGHAVSSSPTALDGLRLAVQDRPDLIVLDLGLPDLDGAEMLRMLRAVSKVPVIVAAARRGGRRLRGQAVQRGPARRPHPRGAAPGGRVGAGADPGGRAARGPAFPAGRAGRDGAGPHAARVRRAGLPGGAGRRGGHQARAAHRGVAAPVRGCGQDGRRAPVVAAQEAGRDRLGTAVPAHGARRRGEAGRAVVRRWLALLVAATTSLVLIALLVPMALLIRAVAENGAMSRATQAAESVAVAVGTAELPLAVERVDAPIT